ncbi:MAG: acyl-CoA reductase [Bacteroidota bacterium]
MDLQKRIKAFLKLGEILNQFVYNENTNIDASRHAFLEEKTEKAVDQNSWFTKDDVLTALKGIGTMLKEEKTEAWLNEYPDLNNQVKKPQTIGVVNAGNIPLVGFHDFLCTLISGNNYLGKLSSKDKILLPALRDILIDYEPEFSKHIHFEENQLKNFDAIIATGSDNTARYFHYYFGKYPNIIRKNRNGVAVIPEGYSMEDLKNLADDIFLYYGLGCRNVSKLFLPENFEINHFFENIEHYHDKLINHHKYANNYDYHKSIYLMNQIPHLDNGFALLKEDEAITSPISTIFYEPYQDIEQVKEKLELHNEEIQCVVSYPDTIRNAVPFGKAQFPELWDYADNIDTLDFLLSLKE